MHNTLSSRGRIILAPMEGVLDGKVRELLSHCNQFDYCVTEFVRVTNTLLPPKTFYRLCPELYQGGKTTTGTPVRVQLLGQSINCLAENADLATSLGSYGVDLNAGCPAKTVTGHLGGAALLKTPELLYQITHGVRRQLSTEHPLSVKIRLGWADKAASLDIAKAVEAGGANEIVIHGRTKEDGYRADRIDWSAIGLIRQQLAIPVIANGEIMSPEAAAHCTMQSGCLDLMLGRGILHTPNLANVIRFNEAPLTWAHVVDLLIAYVGVQPNKKTEDDKPLYHSARIKQWLKFLKITYPAAEELFNTVRTVQSQNDILTALMGSKGFRGNDDSLLTENNQSAPIGKI